MFGGLDIPKKPVYKPRPVPKPSDVPGDRADASGHMAREPNTNYNIKFMQYLQRRAEYDTVIIETLRKKLTEERITAKYIRHSEMKGFKRTLNEKVTNKMKEYDEKIEERRKRLSEILWKEEREQVREVVDNAQKGKQLKELEKLEKVKKIKEQKEAERLAIVKEKKVQQYIARCSEYRPALARQRLRETKQAQLIQMQENESKRKSEEEFEYFWHQMKLKYCAAIDEREEQDRLKREKQNNEFKYYAELQAKEKMVENEKRRQEMLEDAARLEKLKKEIEEEERAFLEKKQIEKTSLYNMFSAQIKEREEMLDRITNQEKQIQRAYDDLADIEIEREIQKQKTKVTTGYQDMILYKQYLEELRQQREEEDYRLGQIIENNQKEIHRKEDEKRCQALMAKQALHDTVMKERAQQIEERRKRDEELQKKEDMEQQLTKESREYNDKLRQEYDRQNLIKAKRYRESLKEQMAYSKVLEEREKANMKKILDMAKNENKIYDNIVANVLKGELKLSETHPFRRIIEEEKCPCPKPNY